jgi:hypothetical protein
MMPKSGHRFSEKIMLKQQAKATHRFNLKSFRFSAPASGVTSGTKGCSGCRYFTGTPAALERAIPGLNILSSAYGSARGDTGLCERHGTFTTASSPACLGFEDNAPVPPPR